MFKTPQSPCLQASDRPVACSPAQVFISADKPAALRRPRRPVVLAEAAFCILFASCCHSSSNFHDCRMAQEPCSGSSLQPLLCLLSECWHLGAAWVSTVSWVKALLARVPSSWFGLEVSVLRGSPSNAAGYHVSYRLRKDAPSWRHLKSGRSGKPET